MANWCCGNLKIRGNISNVENFLRNTISEGEIEQGDDQIYLKNVSGYLKGTIRCFITEEYTQDFIIYDENIIVVIPTEHAWCPKLEAFQELSTKFNVDFRFYGYERGMQYSCEFEIIKGAITLQREIEFNDYCWECPEPLLGG